MGRNRIVKICSIAGFVLAEIYMVFMVLAPYNPAVAAPTRMLIPKEAIPKLEGAVPGVPRPASVIVMQLAGYGIFLGPFGACVGLGVGLLIEGARQKIVSWQSSSRPRK